MQLPAGVRTIGLQVTGAEDTIDIKTIEMVNSTEKANIEKRVQPFKGNPTWMKDAGYGIMTQVGGWLIRLKEI